MVDEIEKLHLDVYDGLSIVETMVDKFNDKRGISLLKFMFIVEASTQDIQKFQPMLDDENVYNWIVDYWGYVHWNEHGDECALSEVGYGRFLWGILEPENYIKCLSDGNSNPVAKKLLAELKIIHEEYKHLA